MRLNFQGKPGKQKEDRSELGGATLERFSAHHFAGDRGGGGTLDLPHIDEKEADALAASKQLVLHRGTGAVALSWDALFSLVQFSSSLILTQFGSAFRCLQTSKTFTIPNAALQDLCSGRTHCFSDLDWDIL